MRDIAHMQDPEAYNHYERGIDRWVQGMPESNEIPAPARRFTDEQRQRVKELVDGGMRWFDAFKSVVIGGTK